MRTYLILNFQRVATSGKFENVTNFNPWNVLHFRWHLRCWSGICHWRRRSPRPRKTRPKWFWTTRRPRSLSSPPRSRSKRSNWTNCPRKRKTIGTTLSVKFNYPSMAWINCCWTPDHEIHAFKKSHANNKLKLTMNWHFIFRNLIPFWAMSTFKILKLQRKMLG